MLQDEFREQIVRLNKAFGTKTFDDDRLGRIWTIVQCLSGADFSRVVDKMLDSLRHAPLPDDFRVAIRPFLPHYQPRSNEPEPDKCSNCYDLGFVWLKNQTEKNLVVCCRCDSGKANHLMNKVIPIAKKDSDVDKINPIHFIPKAQVSNLIDNERVNWWNSVLRKSELYWEKHSIEDEEY